MASHSQARVIFCKYRLMYKYHMVTGVTYVHTLHHHYYPALRGAAPLTSHSPPRLYFTRFPPHRPDGPRECARCRPNCRALHHKRQDRQHRNLPGLQKQHPRTHFMQTRTQSPLQQTTRACHELASTHARTLIYSKHMLHMCM